jgi:hypothetical protein
MEFYVSRFDESCMTFVKETLKLSPPIRLVCGDIDHSFRLFYHESPTMVKLSNISWS